MFNISYAFSLYLSNVSRILITPFKLTFQIMYIHLDFVFRACFKCGEEGHSKADCPQATDEKAPRGCFKCGETGHNKQDCPQATDEEKAPRGCFKCGKQGHSK